MELETNIYLQKREVLLLKKEYLDIYKTYIENNKDTKTANILLQYIDLLEKNQNNMNSEEVIRFYDDLELVIREQF